MKKYRKIYTDAELQDLLQRMINYGITVWVNEHEKIFYNSTYNLIFYSGFGGCAFQPTVEKLGFILNEFTNNYKN